MGERFYSAEFVKLTPTLTYSAMAIATVIGVRTLFVRGTLKARYSQLLIVVGRYPRRTDRHHFLRCYGPA